MNIETTTTSSITGKARGILLCFVLLFLVPTFAGAQKGHLSKQDATPADSLNYYYFLSIRNSSFTSDSKISHDLIPITDNNHSLVTRKIGGETYILVATWKSNVSWYPKNADTIQPYNTGGYDLWVTVAPELKQKMKNVDSSIIDTRIKQLLGLPPYSQYYYFVTFWVRPQDMFRPCPDNEIGDNTCGLCFPANVDPAYRSWVDSQRVSRFFGCDTTSRYPWTQLGYSYDWNPKNATHMGCSEFVIRKFSTIYMKHIYTTNEYIYGK